MGLGSLRVKRTVEGEGGGRGSILKPVSVREDASRVSSHVIRHLRLRLAPVRRSLKSSPDRSPRAVHAFGALLLWAVHTRPVIGG